jgi:hypothetical protein
MCLRAAARAPDFELLYVLMLIPARVLNLSKADLKGELFVGVSI